MASARPTPARPVISRVKLPQPGRGQVRIADITAGSGCADGSRSGSARSAARSVPTPLESSPGPSVVRHVRTPEPRNPAATLESMHSMPRSSSENVLARSLPRTATSLSECDIGCGESPETQGGGGRLPEASVWNLQDMQLDGMGDSMTRASAEDAGWCENPSGFPEQDTRNRSTSSKAKGCSNESGEPIWHPSVEGLLGEARAESGSLRRQRRPQRQSSRACSAELRTQSEPPQHAREDAASHSGQRLPQLIDEIEGHLLQQTVRPPQDASGWMQETAKLELYMQEMQELLTQHLDDIAESAHGPAIRAAGGRGRGGRVHGKVPIRELSVLRGDKDLRWARQQLKNCEREHAHLQHLLGDEDSERVLLAEIRQVESALELEKRRLRNLQKESHKRERSMARAAERAGGGELGSLNIDGNARALKEVERLEAELEVWQMKNASLEKQVEELTARLRDAIQSQERMVSRHRQFHTKESEDAGKKAQEQQRQRQDSQIQEEKELRFEIQSLLEARRSSARSAESTMKERARRLEELRRQQAEKEACLSQLKLTEQQLRRQLRLEHRRPGSTRSGQPRSRAPSSPKRPADRGRDPTYPTSECQNKAQEHDPEVPTRPSLSKSWQTKPDKPACPARRAASSP
ncbi:unnamed protein product [Symbiodinium necroappetens]|uniref:Uncharacterized protein n=1 Tax=Symbiodinium necroappetens TaxID=1628268 RepID=A0A812ZXM8_9DINO|nr:unnamed protein product [Symbiodinium necroappetens]